MNLKKFYIDLVDQSISYFKTGFMGKKHNVSLGDEEKNSDTVEERMGKIEQEIRMCKKCRLHQERRNTVSGKGNLYAEIMFIGEGPGEMEDIKGEPFVGRAGELLTRMLEAIDLNRNQVYITNIVKCRPPENRTPFPDEVSACFPYLEKQIELIKPLIICCLGAPAIKALIGTSLGISRLRGKIYKYKGIPVIPTYHPSAILRFPEKYKRDSWNDLKLLREFYTSLKR